MESKITHGYLVLADISGYTSFMAETELQHSQEIMTDLLGIVVQQLTPMLTLSEVEGDAVFVYAPQEKLIRGETLLEVIEATYSAFKDRIESVHKRTSCTCTACQAITTLDLKFATHFGEFGLQRVTGTQKPIGSSVNHIHRLLKNHIAETTGWRAYALFTNISLEKMDLPPAGMHEQIETYEHLGDIKTYSIDMHKRYDEIVAARHMMITKEMAHITLTYQFNAPPPVVWMYMHEPGKRDIWMAGTHWTAGDRPKGRTGSGATNHCAHGKETAVEKILDWRPFEYATCEFVGRAMTFVWTDHLLPNGDHTTMESRWILKGKLPEWLLKPICKLIVGKMMKLQNNWKLLNELIEQEKNNIAIAA